MSDFPTYEMPAPPILTPWSPESLGQVANTLSLALNSLTSGTWPNANRAVFYPFRLTSWATVYQLLFWVGAISSGNIDVAIYDSQLHRVVSAGSTAMSATVNTVQVFNITDTVLPPGDYYIAGACDNTTGTVFQLGQGDEIMLGAVSIYEQTGLTAAALTDPAVPVVTTIASPPMIAIGAQLRPVF